MALFFAQIKVEIVGKGFAGLGRPLLRRVLSESKSSGTAEAMPSRLCHALPFVGGKPSCARVGGSRPLCLRAGQALREKREGWGSCFSSLCWRPLLRRGCQQWL